MKKLPDIVQWPAGKLDFSGGAIIMGILNVTPDSFSDGGLYQDTDRAVEHGIEMVRQGAAIIDIGPESSRPGAESVSVQEQMKRVIPVIEKLAKKINVPISIDTPNPEVARAAIEAGVSMINDITALNHPDMLHLAVKKQVPVILMHMAGTPETMQKDPYYEDVVKEVLEYLKQRAGIAKDTGIPVERIFIDPGIGFGKTTEHNLKLLNQLDLFCGIGYRVLVGTSRKRFIGQITGKEKAVDRVFGTAATVALAISKGASIVRVHDIEQMAEVVKMSNAVCNL